MMTTDELHTLDLGLQQVVRKIATGLTSGSIIQGGYIFHFRQLRTTKEITITIGKTFVRKAPNAKV